MPTQWRSASQSPPKPPLPPENECISLDCTNASAAFYVQGFGDGFGDGFDA